MGAAGASAASLQVAPVRVELSRDASNALLSVRNAGEEPVRLQADVYGWVQDEEGKMELQPTKDLLVYPFLFELKQGEARNVRVGASPQAFREVERAGRLVIAEVPGAPRQEARKQVRVTTRVSIPVFLAPQRVLEDLQVQPPRIAAGRAALRLVNQGNVSVRPIEVALNALDRKGESIGGQRWEGWYLLAGDARRYQWDIPKDLCRRIAALEVSARLEQKTVTARTDVAGGACAP